MQSEDRLHFINKEIITMSKYETLWDWIKENKTEDFELSFDQIEKITGIPLDHSFLNSKKELLSYGFCVDKISLKNKVVRFKRIQE